MHENPLTIPRVHFAHKTHLVDRGTRDSKEDIRRALYHQEIYQGNENSGISEQEQPIFGKIQTNRNSN